MDLMRWLAPTAREVDGPSSYGPASYGAASLHACWTVLVFAAACEWSYRDGQRSGFVHDKDGSVVINPGLVRVTWERA